ncbi:MAG: Rne/Rng family ribonuclease [Myxococcota bacterium]|nr:Rne/Rng family ribonuclease [Myxococcota bacterium]
MPTRLLISTIPGETRVALLEDGRTVDLQVERKHERSGVGNIYLGRVVRVLPGMQAAFVEIGLEKAGFLYVGDLAGDFDEEQQPRIEEVIKTGDTLLVQVQKAPISTKGARLTCQISLPGRHLVMMPTSDHVGISRRIDSEEERERLRLLIETHRSSAGTGYIARTAAEGCEEDALQRDIVFLDRLWTVIRETVTRSEVPGLIWEDLPMHLRMLRDLSQDGALDILCDEPSQADEVQQFLGKLRPGGVYEVHRWHGRETLWEHFGVGDEMRRALGRKVWLKSGGSIIIDQAEALTAIDINTGSYVGKSNPAETILRTNLEAIPEIVHQLRLRNLGGMVIIDFIDMEAEEHRSLVTESLEQSLKRDPARSDVHGMSGLGLVEITRKRVRESLGRQLSEPCFYCDGRGVLQSRLTTAFEVFRDFAARSAATSEPCLVANVHPEVHDLILDQLPESLAELSERLGKELRVQPKGSYHLEQFDVYAGK